MTQRTALLRLLIVATAIVVVSALVVVVLHLADKPAAANGAGAGRAVAKDGSGAQVSPKPQAGSGPITVTIPAGALEAGTKVLVTTGPAPTLRTASASTGSAAWPDGFTPKLSPVGDTVDVDLGGAELHGTATITFPAPAGLGDGTQVPVAVWAKPGGGYEWLPTSWKKGETTVTAQTTHFSSGFLALLDKPGTAKTLREYFGNYISGRSGVKQPQCGDEDFPREAGVHVTSDGGDRVRWCFGIENNQRVLKIANNTRTFAEVVYPSRWKVVDGFSLTVDTDTVARWVGTHFHRPSSYASRIVDGGDTVTLALPDGDPGGTAEVTMSIVAWTVGAFFFWLDTLLAVDGAANGVLAGEQRGKLDRMALLAGLSTSKEAVKKAPGECLKAGGEMIGDLVESTARGLLKAAFKCGPELAKGLLLGGRLKTYAAGALLSMLITAVSEVLTAANLLTVGWREVWDAVASFGGHSDNVYDIKVTTQSGLLSTHKCQNLTLDDGDRVTQSVANEGITCDFVEAYARGIAKAFTFPVVSTPIQWSGVSCRVTLVSDNPIAEHYLCAVGSEGMMKWTRTDR